MKHILLNLKKSGIVLLAFLLINTSASAVTFTAVTSGNWSSTTTWGGAVPSTTNLLDQIVIPSGIAVNMDNDVTLNGALTLINVDGSLTSSANNSLTLAYGTISGNGMIDIGSVVLGAGSAIAFTGTFATNNLTNTALNLQAAANFTVREMLTLTSGVLSIQSGGNLTLGNNATIVLSGGKLLTNGGTLGLASTYNVNYQSADVIGGLELGGSGLNNLTVAVGSANMLTLAGNLTVNGLLNLSSGTLVIGSNNLTLNGDVTSAGGGTIKSSNGSLTFNSTSGVNGTLNFSGTSNTVNNLTVNVGNLNKAQIGGQLTVNGNLLLTSGTLQLNSSNLTVTGGIAATGTGNISSTSTSNIVINTASSPLGSLTFASGGNTVNNLTINIGGYGTVELKSDLTVNGNLNLTSGHLDIGNNKLTVSNNAGIIGSSSTSYIITGTSGSLALNVSALDLSGVKYPVGTSTNYFPAVVVLGIGSTGGQVNVGVINNVYAQGTTGTDLSATQHVVDATWMVSSNITSNLNMNLKVMWASAAEVNGFMRNQAHISHYVNGNWDMSANVAATAETNGMFSISRSGITSLSPFAVYDASAGSINTKFAEPVISVYPNPGNDMVAVNNITSSEPVTMDILNFTGQVVASYNLTNDTNTVSIGALAAGHYTIRLHNSTMNSSQRFIKN